jgi:hypothetical protein
MDLKNYTVYFQDQRDPTSLTRRKEGHVVCLSSVLCVVTAEESVSQPSFFILMIKEKIVSRSEVESLDLELDNVC